VYTKRGGVVHMMTQQEFCYLPLRRQLWIPQSTERGAVKAYLFGRFVEHLTLCTERV
jgi:hypothetical protein